MSRCLNTSGYCRGSTTISRSCRMASELPPTAPQPCPWKAAGAVLPAPAPPDDMGGHLSMSHLSSYHLWPSHADLLCAEKASKPGGCE